MQTVRVRTTQNVLIDYPLASIGDRILGHLIDRLILIAYSVAVVFALADRDVDLWYIWLLLLGIPWMFFSVLFEIFMNGQTPGKQLMKTKVVRLNGTPATVGDYLLRWVFSLVDFYILSGAIALVAVAMGGKGQRIGDMVAGTSVVKLIEQREFSAKDVFVATDETHVPTFTQVTQLSDKDIELIQHALEVNRDHGNGQPVMVITEKIKMLLSIQTDLPPVQFLYTIIKDYNSLTTGR
ncbi:MAG TPA: RDD family protein [Chryseolinea sp.]|nr:RDD family protein [Chryseolinea sp.]